MSFYKGFRQGMNDFSHGIATIVNSLLLSIVYIIGVGITSIIARLTGKQFLQMKKVEKTYWHDLNLGKKPIEEYYRQF